MHGNTSRQGYEIEESDGVEGELEYQYCDPTQLPTCESVNSVGHQDPKLAEMDVEYYAGVPDAPVDRGTENIKLCNAPASSAAMITMTESVAYDVSL